MYPITGIPIRTIDEKARVFKGMPDLLEREIGTMFNTKVFDLLIEATRGLKKQGITDENKLKEFVNEFY